MTNVTLADGPIAGLTVDVPQVGEGVPLRFNASPGRQHVYHFRGTDQQGGVIYEYQGDDEGVVPGLEDPGIDLPQK